MSPVEAIAPPIFAKPPVDSEDLNRVWAMKVLGRETRAVEIELLARLRSRKQESEGAGGPFLFIEGRKTRRIKNLWTETIFRAGKTSGADALKRPGLMPLSPQKRWTLAFRLEAGHWLFPKDPYAGASALFAKALSRIMTAGPTARPIAAADILCLPPLDSPDAQSSSRRSLRQVVSGVRDYGNCAGVATASGALYFGSDRGAEPTAAIAAIGILPSWAAVQEEAKPGDAVVLFGSLPEEDADPGACALEQTKLLEALCEAGERKLFRAARDASDGVLPALLDAGGRRGVSLKAPAKHPDLFSSPGRLFAGFSAKAVLAVPQRNVKALEAAAAKSDVPCTVLGAFTAERRLVISASGQTLADIDLKLLAAATAAERRASWSQPKSQPSAKQEPVSRKPGAILKDMLAHPNVCSREWIIRQYDHEAQGGTIIKPLQGLRHDGPGDAVVLWPHAATGDMGQFQGFAIAHGLNPSGGEIDPKAMAMACAEEALRNLVCVGADITRASFAAAFNPAGRETPQALGALVLQAQGLAEASRVFKVPVLSAAAGNERSARQLPLLAITAIAPVADVRKTITMDIKGPGNALYLVGWTSGELGGSLYNEVNSIASTRLAETKPAASLQTLRAVQAAIARGLVLSAHDLSEGGLAVALAEAAFSGEFGAVIDLGETARPASLMSNDALLFGESTGRILLEVKRSDESPLLKCLKGAQARRIGETCANPILKVIGLEGIPVLEEPLSALKNAWQGSLSRAL